MHTKKRGGAKSRSKKALKKLFLLLLLLFPTVLLAWTEIALTFNNGATVDYLSDSYWTTWNWKHDYYKYFNWGKGKEIKNTDYLCFYDNSCMNPVSRETKRQDYKNLRDLIQATGNEANYFEDNGTVSDDWCVSVRYDQLESARDDSYFWIYKDGEKHNEP